MCNNCILCERYIDPEYTRVPSSLLRLCIRPCILCISPCLLCHRLCLLSACPHEFSCTFLRYFLQYVFVILFVPTPAFLFHLPSAALIIPTSLRFSPVFPLVQMRHYECYKRNVLIIKKSVLYIHSIRLAFARTIH